jgi:hypothetical protein
MVTRCCAAWLILLVASPFTAPFRVCEVGTSVRIVDRPSLPSNDLEEWFVDGGIVFDFPVTPVAGEFKIASLAVLGTADFVEVIPAAPFDAPVVAAMPIGRAPTLMVLRL